MSLFDIFKPKAEEPVNPNAKLVADAYKASNASLKDIISPSAIGVESRNMTIGNLRARSFFVMSFPRYLTDNWFSPIVNLDKVFDVGIHISPLDTAEVMKQFQTKVAEVESQIMIKEEKGLVRDPQLETAYEDLENLRDELMQAQEKMFTVGIYITIYGGSDEELDKVENEIKNILESKIIQIRPTLFQEAEGFITSLPFGLDKINFLVIMDD